MAGTLRGSVQESPVRRQPHAQKTKSAGNSCSWKLDFVSTLCQSVINLHLKHGKRFFNSSAPAQARPGRKFGIESAVDFERVTRSSR